MTLERSSLWLATEEDTIDILYMAEQFHNESPYSLLPFSNGKTIEMIQHFITLPKEEAVCILGCWGIIAGHIVSPPTSDTRIAVEQLWYVTPDSRGSRLGLELINAYEYWAQHVAKADGIQMGSLSTLCPDKVAKIYERKNMKETERTYFRCFSQDS